MRPQRYLPVAIFTALFLFHASGATLFVSLNSTNPVPPYASWNTAATNIQDAVDVSTNGDLVLVTNGVYQSSGRLSSDGATNCVIVTNAITLKSVNGPAATLIDGRQLMRGVYLPDGAILAGFTITNGNAFDGGGVWATNGGSAIVSNCVLAGNIAGDWGGGAYGSQIISSLIIQNRAYSGGGVAYSQVTNSVIQSNSGAAYGGGAELANLWYSKIFQNTAGYGGGADASSLYGCLIVSNAAVIGGGVEHPSSLVSCTVVGNLAGQLGGGCDGGNFTHNCIVYYNFVSTGTESNFSGIVRMNNCCTTPLPDFGSINNITNAPSFVDCANGDFHLQSNSPCINSGNNPNLILIGNTDLDGNPRIVGGTVDIGIYEYQTPVSQISYAWLQQYGLPITTNIDTSDPDGDGLNNYQEWFAGTDPTNALSVLAMLPPVPTNNPTGLIVSWQVVSVKRYYVQRTTNLGTPLTFLTIRTNISAVFAQNGILSMEDTSATNAGPYFYRVGVQ
jgi:hypothetical protein